MIAPTTASGVLRRDKSRCQRCNAMSKLSLRRLNSNRKDTVANLITVCDSCRDWIEANRDTFPSLTTRAGIIGGYPLPLEKLTYSKWEIGQGYRRPEDGIDVWALWVRQGRKGAKDLLARVPTPPVLPEVTTTKRSRPVALTVASITSAKRNPEARPCRNLCGSCAEDFASLTAFDRHRIGKHPNGRRCMSESEKEAAGMERDPDGRWRLVLDDASVDRLAALSTP